MKKQTIAYLLFFMLFTLVSCAPEPACETKVGETYGFISGLVHGLVFPIALIGKVVGVDTGLYAVNNSGLLYWLGFLLGFLVIYGGIFGARRRRY